MKEREERCRREREREREKLLNELEKVAEDTLILFIRHHIVAYDYTE